jgi:hypothetical protein
MARVFKGFAGASILAAVGSLCLGCSGDSSSSGPADSGDATTMDVSSEMGDVAAAEGEAGPLLEAGDVERTETDTGPDVQPETGHDAEGDGVMDAEASDDAPSDGEGGMDAEASDDAASDGEGGMDAEASDDRPDDAPDDGEGGTDSGPLGDGESGCTTATECLIETQFGQDCLDCARRQCADAGLWCEHLAAQTAVSGPSVGQSRSSLCLSTLSCIFASECYAFGSTPDACYCGESGCTDAGPGSDATQACFESEQDGLETTDFPIAVAHFGDTTLGAGTANALLNCLGGCTSCP